MTNNNKSFEFINNLTPKDIRGHLNNLRRLPQCSNIKFWDSLSVIEFYLEAKGLAELNPQRLSEKIMEDCEKQEAFLRKDKAKS